MNEEIQSYLERIDEVFEKFEDIKSADLYIGEAELLSDLRGFLIGLEYANTTQKEVDHEVR